MENRHTTKSEIRQLNGAWLYNLRKKHNLTQSQCANIIGVTVQQIRKDEEGQNAMSTTAMHIFANTFGVTMDYFFKPLPIITYERK